MKGLPDGANRIDGWHPACGARVGHAQVGEAPTGCTVVLLDAPAPYAALASGGGPSTRQVSALHPHHAVTTADAFLVVGGSAYGLDAAGGVLRWLEAKGRGTQVGRMRVPAVPTAAVFDLFVAGTVRPDASTGAAACDAATADGVLEGRVGAGAGATVGKILGIDFASWGGVGTASVELAGGLVVSAVAVVNAFGNVHGFDGGACVAGARDGAGGFVDVEAAIGAGAFTARRRELEREASEGGNTTIGVVVTNGRLDPGACGRAAVLVSQALPMCIHPCQTAVDGDTVFVASTGTVEAEAHQVGLAGREALARAIVRAVTAGRRDGPEFPARRS